MRIDIDRNAPPLFDCPHYSLEKHPYPTPPKSALPISPPLRGKPDCCFLSPKPYKILSNICSISACIHQNAAVDSRGGLWTWGEIPERDPVTINYDIPPNISYIPEKKFEDVLSVSVGFAHTLAVTKGHQLWGWGRNSAGELGLGDFTFRTEPTLIMDDVQSAYANEENSFVIKRDQSLWGWGCNEQHIIFRDSPVCNIPIHLADHIVQIVATSNYILTVNSDGELWGWGRGRLGLFSFNPYTPVYLMSDVLNISVSPITGDCCLIVTQDHALYTFGAGGVTSIFSQKLRNEMEEIPVKVMERVKAAYAGRYFSFFLTDDGQLLALGDNSVGQCGTGKSTSAIKRPRPIFTHICDAACGHCHAMGLQNNGDLWIWGGSYGLPYEDEGEV